VIGVLEYINRTGEPPFEPFSPDEMDRAACFADAIASLVNAYESAKLFRDLGQKVIEEGAGFDLSEIRAWLRGLRDSSEHREMMDLALVVREIATRGEAERFLCRDVLESILKYSDSKSETSFLGY
jgi:hypothetical protein